jgi:hypothetical protein
MSKTISKFQTPKPLDTKKIKQIVGPVAPDLKVEQFIVDEIVKKEEDRD